MGFIWTSELEIGIEDIDFEHKKILEITNQFLEYYNTEKSDKIVKETIEFLINYADEHFKNEEKILLEYQYPPFEHHKKQHDSFKVLIESLYEDIVLQGVNSTNLAKLHNLITEWITKHIKTFDKAYVDYYKRKTAL